MKALNESSRRSLGNRYQVLAESSIHTYDDENLTSYADFLSKFGRYICKDGFIDSDSTIHRYKLKQKEIDRSRCSTQSPTRIKINTPTSSPNVLNSIDIKQNNELHQKNYEKHLRAIEDQMIKSKQEERAFKRYEGDVKKEQRAIRHAMRDLDTIVSKKHYIAEKNLSKNLEEKQRIEVENTQKKENDTKERTKLVLDELQFSKDNNRKFVLIYNDLSRQYKLKMNELEKKHLELMRLSADYSAKMQLKEEEEAKLKKDISEIALAMNMESMKAKKETYLFDNDYKNIKEVQLKSDLKNEMVLNEKLANTNRYIKTFDLTRRRLSHEALTQKSEWMLRQREAKRRLIDFRNKLEDIYTKQYNIIDTADVAEREDKAFSIKQKLEDANNRKVQETERQLSERNKKIEYEHTENEKAKYKLLELDRLSHEENLKDLQKVLQKQNLKELELYQTVKEIEFARRNQEKELENLEKKLETKNKNNAYVVKNMSTNIFTDEEKIRNAIVKEKAHLEKLQFDRDDKIHKLLIHREKTKEYKYQFESYQKECARLANILNKAV